MKKKVFHFLPSLDMGGVEIAVEKSIAHLRQQIDISVFYVRRHGSLEVGQVSWRYAIKHIFKSRPDVVVTSLWWAHPFGLLFKLVGVRWICFIHNAGLTHLIDKIICTAAIWGADEIATDSTKTEKFVLSLNKKLTLHVIPYIFPPALDGLNISRVKKSFIFVGRNVGQKRLDLVVDFFRYFLKKYSDITCRFVIAGQTSMIVTKLENSFDPRVSVEYNISNDEVMLRLYSSEYFVMLSDYEGFSMSTYEAVQAGCFVIYRDVGEIGKYITQNLSFNVVSLKDFYVRFDKIFKMRNLGSPVNNLHGISNSKLDYRLSYTSEFLKMIKS